MIVMAKYERAVVEKRALRLDTEDLVPGVGFDQATIEQDRQIRDVRINNIDIDLPRLRLGHQPFDRRTRLDPKGLNLQAGIALREFSRDFLVKVDLEQESTRLPSPHSSPQHRAIARCLRRAWRLPQTPANMPSPWQLRQGGVAASLRPPGIERLSVLRFFLSPPRYMRYSIISIAHSDRLGVDNIRLSRIATTRIARDGMMQIGVFDHLDQGNVPLSEYYETRFRLIEEFERAGLYAYHVAEHHFTPLGMAPSPSVYLAAIAQRTKRLRFGPLVYALPLYHPLRLIQEICMLDQISGGELEIRIRPWGLVDRSGLL